MKKIRKEENGAASDPEDVEDDIEEVDVAEGEDDDDDDDDNPEVDDALEDG